MDFMYILMTPFTWLLMFFYQFFNSYGVALILFTLLVKIILFPFSLKAKKSMIQTNMLSGQMRKLQKQYANNQAKYNEELQKLYAREGVNPTSGCLWSFLPMFILIPLFAILREPLKYMMGVVGSEAEQMLQAIAVTLNWDTVAVEAGWIAPKVVTEAIAEAAKKEIPYITAYASTRYNQMFLTSLITPENLEAVKAAVAAVGAPAKELFVLNTEFLGINLFQQPTLKFWVNGFGWDSIGLFLLPILSVVLSALFMMVTNKTNAINNPDAVNMNWGMTAVMSLMYLYFGFSMPAAISVYFMANSVLGMGQEFITAKMLKKDYEEAREKQRLRELEEKEEEKRLRREKAEAKALAAEEARKNKGKKQPKDADDDRIPPEVREASRVGIRQYARGRAYDPARYGEVTPYNEKAIESFFIVPEPKEKKKKGKKTDDQPDTKD